MKNVSLKSVLLVLFAGIALLGNAQSRFVRSSYAVYLEPQTYVSNTIAPFDNGNWYVYFPIDSNISLADIRKISVYEVTGNGEKMHPVKTTNRYREIVSDTLKVLKNGKSQDVIRYHDSLFMRKKDNRLFFAYNRFTPKQKALSYFEGDLTKYVTDTAYPGPGPYRYIKIVMQQLPPNVKFKIKLFHGLNKEAYKKLHDFTFNIEDAGANTLFQQLEDNAGEGDLGEFSVYQDFYTKQLKKQYEVLKAESSDLGKALSAVSGLSKGAFSYEKLNACFCDKQYANSRSDSLRPIIIQLLRNIYYNKEGVKNAAQGFIDVLDEAATEPLKITDVQKRIANLKKLSNSLKTLNYFVRMLCCEGLIPAEERPALLAAIEKATALADDGADKLAGAELAIRKAINSYNAVFGATEANLVNESQDIKSAAGNYLIPDVGLVNIFSVLPGAKGDAQFKNMVRPYWGLNISFVPLNKNQNLRDVRYHKAAHYFSFTIGLTAGPINRSGATDLIKGMSLVTGIGIRPFKWGRITIGDVMYLRDNPNPAKFAKLAFAPAVGFSVDLDVVSWAQTLAGKLF